jgi:hypothetical protein
MTWIFLSTGSSGGMTMSFEARSGQTVVFNGVVFVVGLSVVEEEVVVRGLTVTTDFGTVLILVGLVVVLVV